MSLRQAGETHDEYCARFIELTWRYSAPGYASARTGVEFSMLMATPPVPDNPTFAPALTVSLHTQMVLKQCRCSGSVLGSSSTATTFLYRIAVQESTCYCHFHCRSQVLPILAIELLITDWKDCHIRHSVCWFACSTRALWIFWWHSIVLCQTLQAPKTYR